MNNLQKFIEKHSSAILTGISVIGVGVTTGLAINSTIKAVKIIEDKTVELTKHEKVYADNSPYTVAIPPKFTKKDILYYTWKQYIPVAVSGLSTVLCIFGIHHLNKRTQTSLISAYALLDNTYKEYRKKIQEQYPDDPKVVDFEHEIIKSKFDKNMELDKDKQLFFDYQSMRYFESTLIFSASSLIVIARLTTSCVTSTSSLSLCTFFLCLCAAVFSRDMRSCSSCFEL